MGQESSENHRLRTFGSLQKAGIGLALIVALGGIGVALVFPAPWASEFDRFWSLGFVGFPVLGALMLWRRPGNRIGLIMLFIGSVVGLALGVTSAAFRVGDEQLSAALEAAASQVIIPALMLIVALVILFPSGRPSSWRWEVAAFGDRLQGAVDLSSVTSDLGRVIAKTVKPASAAIWIRD